MKLYSSFLLRCWVLQDGAEKIVFDIEHIQKGERLRATSPDEAMQWILTMCQNSQSSELETDEIPPQSSPTGNHE